MKKSKKPNLSQKEIAKNKKRVVFIISLLVISCLILVGISFGNKEKIVYVESSRYYTGSLYTANHAANMVDYVSKEDNIAISPFNINTSLAVLYNGTDNNTSKEIKTYFEASPKQLNEQMKNKISSIKEEPKEENKYTNLYKSLMNTLFSKSYDTLSVEMINLLNTREKEDILLLIRKINLTKERINKLNNLSEKNIKNYKLSQKEINYNSYSLKTEIEKVLNDYESYSIDNKVNNYTEIYMNDISKKEIEKEYLENTKIYNYKITELTTEDSENTAKKINENIKNATEDNVTRIVDEHLLDPKDIMVVNSLYFNYEWDKSFAKESVSDTEFYGYNEEISVVEMMYDVETKYLENDYALGFIKDFENKKYSFIGILPKKDEELTLSSLNLNSLLLSEKEETILIGLPKLNYQSETDLNKLLKNYKIEELFSEKANFTRLTEEQVKLESMTQKINISIGERGTVDSTINVSEIKTNTEEEYEKQIILNRPFAYLIKNNESGDIMLIGKVVTINEGS